jgi:ribosome-associated protein
MTPADERREAAGDRPAEGASGRAGGAAPDDDGEGFLRVSRGLKIPLRELSWRFTASGGPGGQHANTSNTKVEVRFDVANSPSLGPHQRSRLLEQLGPVVRVVASDERSQHRNRELALERLASRLATALATTRTRTPTRPTRSSVRRRLTDKRRQSDLKRSRQTGPDD